VSNKNNTTAINIGNRSDTNSESIPPIGYPKTHPSVIAPLI